MSVEKEKKKIEQVNVKTGEVSVIGSTTIVHPPKEDDKNDTDYDTDDETDKNKNLPPRLRLILASEISPAFKDPYSSSIYHVGTSGMKVTVIDDLSHLKELRQLTLRSNLVRNIQGLKNSVSLVVLELYENRIKSLKGLENLVNLEVLDISYNRIRYLEHSVLCNFKKLRKLYMAQNKLTKIEGLDELVNLEMLDLGMNRIERIEGLQNNVNLEELWLGKNKITAVEGIETLTKLIRLDIQSNRLQKLTTDKTLLHAEDDKNQTTIEEREKKRRERVSFLRAQRCSSHGHSHGETAHASQPAEDEIPKERKIDKTETSLPIVPVGEKKATSAVEQTSLFKFVPTLQELYLSHQGISCILGLEKLHKLTILDLTANKIKDLSAFQEYNFELLEDLWLGENEVAEFAQINHLAHLGSLETLYLEHNPIAKEENYRKLLAETLPQLKQIDALRI